MANFKDSEVYSEKIGENTQIWQYTIVLQKAVIGKNCNINSHCFIENDVLIGDRVTIKCGVYVWDGITLENDVFIGPNVTFLNDKFPRSRKSYNLLRTVIKAGASIGAASTILPGLTIGEHSMVGAGSRVTKDIPNNTLWLGNPAKQVGNVCDCSHRLNLNLHCINCNEGYILINNQIVIK